MTIFSQHEVVSFIQLRYTWTRSLRQQIARQFNYYQSIIKRLWIDWNRNQEHNSARYFDPVKFDNSEHSFSNENNHTPNERLSDDYYVSGDDGLYIFSESGEERVYGKFEIVARVIIFNRLHSC